MNAKSVQQAWDKVLTTDIQCEVSFYALTNSKAFTLEQLEQLANKQIGDNSRCNYAKLLMLIVGIEKKDRFIVEKYRKSVLDWNPDLFTIKELLIDFDSQTQ